MTNVPLKKVTVLGPMDNKDIIVKNIQALGLVHVIPLTESEKQLQASPGKYYEALRYLMQSPEQRTPLRREPEGKTAQDIIDRVNEIKYTTIRLSNRRDKLQRHLKQTQHWGDFVIPDAQEIGGYNLYFYKVPYFKLKALSRIPNLIYQQVYKGNLNAYIVVLAKEEPDHTAMPGKQITFEHKSRHDAMVELDNVIFQLEELDEERHRLTRYIPFLLNNLHHIEDKTIYDYVMDRTLDDDKFFAFQGWVPSDKVADIHDFTYEYGAAVHIEDPTEDDTPPTLFKNPHTLKGGEELVKFYQMPAYRAWDPSIIVYLSFAVFFAMIMSDAGYALLLGAVLFLFRKKLGKTDTGRRMFTLGLVISGVSFIYGVLAGSYFGMSPMTPILENAKVLDVTDFDIMMKFSIIIGVIHLIAANAIMAWHNRRSFHGLSYVGWIMAFAGGLGLWLLEPAPALTAPSALMLMIGMVLVLLFSSQRKIDGVKSFGLRFGEGLLGVANLSKAFGDVLSYMRLFALGLASASLAVMFNEMAGQMSENLAGIGAFLALIILILGHGLNFLLAIMGGVVHGLRLNLIEFFSWSIKDEGYAFEPFSLKEQKEWKTQ